VPTGSVATGPTETVRRKQRSHRPLEMQIRLAVLSFSNAKILGGTDVACRVASAPSPTIAAGCLFQ
jgi:hypothetical protein